MTNNMSKWDLSTLQDFQERVSDLSMDSATCRRFLVAREYNLDAAEDMIRNNVKWRQEIRIEYLFSNLEVPTEIKKELPFRFTGTSRNGGPVLCMPLGRWSARYWVERGKKDEVTRVCFYVLESILRRMKAMNNKQCVAILGMEELSYYKISNLDTLKVVYTAFQTLEQNYPEVLQNLIVVNAPWVFPIGFNFVKPILSPRTLAKIQIFGSKKEEWLPALRQVCLDDAVPEEYL